MMEKEIERELFTTKSGSFVVESESYPYVIHHDCGALPVFFFVYNPALDSAKGPRFISMQVMTSPFCKTGTNGRNVSALTTQRLTNQAYYVEIKDEEYPRWPVSKDRMYIVSMDELTITIDLGQYAQPFPLGETMHWIAVYRRG